MFQPLPSSFSEYDPYSSLTSEASSVSPLPFSMSLNPFSSQAEYTSFPFPHPSKILFELKDDARIACGFQSLSILERAYQQACHFAEVQSEGETSYCKRAMGYSLMENPDTQRMLLTMKCFIEVSRSILYQTALTVDSFDSSLSDDNQSLQRSLQFLLPLANGWVSSKSAEMTLSAFQIFSNMGFNPDHQMAKFYYEESSKALSDATSMFHASNLVLKAIPIGEGEGFRPFFHSMDYISSKCMTDISQDDLYTIGEYLDTAKDDFLQSSEWMLQKSGFLGQGEEALAGATPFMTLFGLCLGGLHLSQQALFATEQLSDESLMPQTQKHYQNRIDMARFYAENFLPHVKALSVACTRGTSSLKAFNPYFLSLD